MSDSRQKVHKLLSELAPTLEQEAPDTFQALVDNYMSKLGDNIFTVETFFTPSYVHEVLMCEKGFRSIKGRSP